MPDLLKEIKGNVGILTLNRPKRLNAWTEGMKKRLFDSLLEFEKDSTVRVIVITGAGRGFCAGADMMGLQAKSGAKSKKKKEKIQDEYDNRTVIFATTIKKPIICAINGPVAGIGLAFALACDIRFANKKAKFTLAFSKRGLVAEHGTSWTLPRLMGMGNALMFAMSSDIILADEAYRMGIVQKVFDDNVLLHTIEYAQRLADYVSPNSMAVIKQQIWNHANMSVNDATHQSIELMIASLRPSNTDFKEGVTSFVQKRKPNFDSLTLRNPAVQLGKSYFSKL